MQYARNDVKKILFAISTILLCLVCACSREVVPEYDASVNIDIEDVKQVYPSISDVPVIYIDVDRDLWLVNREEYVGAVVTIPDSGIIEVDAKIKGRGNASWLLPQKPYNIKFYSKTDLFGMGEAKKWVLITLYYDKTLLRNYLTLNLAKIVSSGPEMDCMFVDVVINGEYNGLYLLTEKIEDGKNRVDISKKNGDVLFEIEQPYRHDNKCDNCIQLKSGTHLTFKDPDVEDLTADELSEKLSQMRDFFDKADDAIRSKNYDKFSEYIDVDSFISWYIVNEFVKNYDSQFVTSCYCYVKDGKLYMGPCWDYDTCMGNQDVATCLSAEGYHVSMAPWYHSLLKNDTFFELLCKRWQKLSSQGVFDDLLTFVDEQTAYLSSAAAAHFECWPDSLQVKDLRGGKSLFTYEEEVEYLKNWIRQRVEWLDKNWG